MNREILLNSLEEFMEETDARLTALEAAKPQMDGAASCDEMLDTLLLSNADKRADNAHLTAEVKRERERNAALVAEVARLNTFLAQQADPDKAILAEALKERTAELSFMNQRRDALAAELGDRIKERKTAWAEVDALKAQRNTLAAQVDDLRNVNAGLRKSLDAAQADNKQLASERKTLSSVWHALKIDNERLAAEVDRLRNIESAAPNPPNHTDSEKLAFARNEIDWLRNTLDEAQARIRHLEATWR